MNILTRAPRRALLAAAAALMTVQGPAVASGVGDLQATAAGELAAAQVIELERRFEQAVLHGEYEAIDAMLDPQFSYIDTRASVIGRTAFVEAQRRVRYTRHEYSELEARAWGETVVVTGRAEVGAVAGDAEIQRSLRYTRVWVKRDGRWVSAALQTTRLP
jgi:hypothetical protein